MQTYRSLQLYEQSHCRDLTWPAQVLQIPGNWSVFDIYFRLTTKKTPQFHITLPVIGDR